MSREAFEVWFSDQGQFPMACEKGRGGFYLLQHANTSWIAWQAATAAALEEAAGYAHAIKVIKRLRDSHQTATGECQSDCDFVAAWDSAIDALRGEVKP